MNEVGRAALDSTTFNLRNGSLSLTLRFSGRALAVLRSDIGAGFVSAARPESETGGILRGDMAQQGSQWVVMVDAVRPVAIEYQYGPTYRLSAADKQQFRELAHAGDFGSRPIGWYRTNTRPDKDIDEADRQIGQTFFGVNQSIFLLCEPTAGRGIHATCVVILPRRTEVAFSFELGEFSQLESLAGALAPEQSGFGDATLAPPPFGAAPVPAPARIPDAAVASAAPSPVARAALGSPLARRNLKIAAAVAAAAVVFWYARGRVFSPSEPGQALPGQAVSGQAAARAEAVPGSAASLPVASDAPSLGLRAEYQGNSLLLGWDRSAPAIAAASSGSVTIADGNLTRVIRLTPRDLRTGSILYKPSADDIDVEFDIVGPSGTTGSQSIRIIGAAPPTFRSDARSDLRSDARPVSPASPPPRAAPQVIPHAAPPTRAVTQFQPPPQARPQPRSIATSDAPLITQARPETGTILLPSTVMLPPGPAAATPAPAAHPVQRAPQTAAQAAASGSVAAGNAARPPVRTTNFQPAVVIRSAQPPFPLNPGLPPDSLDRPIEVKVEIRIDSKGRVMSTRMAADNRPNVAAFAAGALGAARSWLFRPAMLDGKPIDSTMIVTFRYTKPARRE